MGQVSGFVENLYQNKILQWNVTVLLFFVVFSVIFVCCSCISCFAAVCDQLIVISGAIWYFIG